MCATCFANGIGNCLLMDEKIIFYIWGATAFIHTLYLSWKLIFHVNTGYAIHFWFGLWVYEPNVFDKEGQKIRKKLLVAMAIYFLFGLIVLRLIKLFVG